MASSTPAQRAELRQLGYSQSEINGMSFKDAQGKLNSGRVVARSRRDGAGMAAPPAETSSAPERTALKSQIPDSTTQDRAPKAGKSVIPSSGIAAPPEVAAPDTPKGTSRTPDSGSKDAPRNPPGKSALPDTADAKTKADKLAAFIESTSDGVEKAAPDAKGSKIIADFAKGKTNPAADGILDYVVKHGAEGLRAIGKVAGPIASLAALLGDATPANEGEAKQIQAIKDSWEVMDADQRKLFLNGIAEQANAPVAPAGPARSGVMESVQAVKEGLNAAAGLPADNKPAEGTKGPLAQAGESIGDFLGGLVPPHDPATGRREVVRTEPDPNGVPISGAPAPSGLAAPPAQGGASQAAPTAPLPAHKPAAPPPQAPAAPAARPSGPPSAPPKPQDAPPQPAADQPRLADEKNLGDMLAFMKQGGVQAFEWNGMKFQAGDSPSGYQLAEAAAPEPGPNTLY